MTALSIGIIGSGFMARTHACAIMRYLTRARLLGVAGGTRAGDVASEFSTQLFPSVEQLLGSPDIQAVVITSPHALHRDHALACAEHDKHCLVEKPMAASVRECHDMVSTFRKHDLRLMVAQTQRFRTSNRTAFSLIRSGAIGSIRMVQEWALLPNGLQAYPAWQRKPENLGILFGYGVHNLDRMRWFLDSEAESVSAAVVSSTGSIETSTMATMKWRSGAIANLWSSVDLLPPGFDGTAFRSLLVGDRGSIDVDGYGAVRVSTDAKPWETVFVQPPIDWRGSGMFSEARMGSFAAQDQAFVDAVLDGTEPPVTGIDGLRATELALACYESARINASIQLLP